METSRQDRRCGLLVMGGVGAALAVLSTGADFSIDGPGAATACLVLMHLVVGIAYVVSLEFVASRRPAVTPAPWWPLVSPRS